MVNKTAFFLVLALLGGLGVFVLSMSGMMMGGKHGEHKMLKMMWGGGEDERTIQGNFTPIDAQRDVEERGAKIAHGENAESSNGHQVAKEDGYKLFSTYCGACHDIMRPKRAPGIMGVAGLWRRHHPNKDDFIRAISDWVRNPSPSKMKLCGCVVRRFGYMPPVAVPEEKMRVIAEWLWELGEGKENIGRCGGEMKMMGGC